MLKIINIITPLYCILFYEHYDEEPVHTSRRHPFSKTILEKIQNTYTTSTVMLKRNTNYLPFNFLGA